MLSCFLFLFLLAAGTAHSEAYNAAGSQNETFVLEEIAQISKCGVSSRYKARISDQEFVLNPQT